MDKYAAEAEKAHAHMFQDEFDQAKILLDDLIDNGGFSLASNFYDNYDMTHENNIESIFEIQALTTSTFHTAIFPAGAAYHQKGPSSCGGWGFFQPSFVPNIPDFGGRSTPTGRKLQLVNCHV